MKLSDMTKGGFVLLLATSSYLADRDEMDVDVVPIIREGDPVPCACGCGAPVPADRGPRSGSNVLYASDLCKKRAQMRRYRRSRAA